MELQDILNLALSREQATIEFYTDLLETYQKLGKLEKKAKDLFLFLIKEKTQHKQLVEKKIENLCPPAMIGQS